MREKSKKGGNPINGDWRDIRKEEDLSNKSSRKPL